MNAYSKFQIDISKHVEKSPENSDGRLSVWTNPQHDVWTGKLSELQLPVQNPAREGICKSMSY